MAKEKTSSTKNEKNNKNFPIVGIGSSAGGLDALKKFFQNMPAENDMAFVLVPHLDPDHPSAMADLMRKYTEMKVDQVEDGMEVEPNHVYVIPPNKDLAIINRILQLLDPAVKRGLRHPIDYFFRSLAKDQKENAVCIVLSGTGTEGTLGLKDIKGEGGMVMVQDPESSGYNGMPHSAWETNLADFVLPPEKMPEQLINYKEQFYVRRKLGTDSKITRAEQDLQKIFILIRDQTGQDFSFYRRNTILRRIDRRMSVNQIDRMPDYVRYLQQNPVEVETLFKEFLIAVTSFFRDPGSFEFLKEKVVPTFFEKGIAPDPIRIWVPGCSTGEEAYSLAMLLQEYMKNSGKRRKIQIFATDIDLDALKKARQGGYPESIRVDVSPERLEHYFVREDNSFKIKNKIREMVVFAPHNVIYDQPFSKMDLVSCRNLLIYLEPEIQEKVLLLFSYSLKAEGFLFLGTSETIGDQENLFSVVSKKWKIFKSKTGVALPPMVGKIPAGVRKPQPYPAGRITGETGRARNMGELLQKILFTDYTPPAAIINEQGEILYIHGRTGKYLEPASGKATLSIQDMAREGLKYELTAAIHQAIREKKEVTRKEILVRTNGDNQALNLSIRPIKEPHPLQGTLLVVFEEIPSGPVEGGGAAALSEEKYHQIREMELELTNTREDLQSTIEELETANEELQSTNEELQSSNEELETSHEELQSANEELVTINSEYQEKIEELSALNDDIVNLFEATDIATIFLDNELGIKRFTPAATRVINLIETDVGRPVADVVLKLEYDGLLEDVAAVLDNLNPIEKEIRDREGNCYKMGITPYRTTGNVIKGVVLTFVDITALKVAEDGLRMLNRELEQRVEERTAALKESEEAIRESRDYAENIVDTVREPLLVLNGSLQVVSANRSFYQTFKVDPGKTEGRLLYELGNHQWDIPELRKLLEEILTKKTSMEDYKVEHDFELIGKRIMLLNARSLFRESDKTQLILLAIEDITVQTPSEAEVPKIKK